ncbi:MAG: TonB-dependent receptor [Endomicrobiales bacterium]|nr:TonB-dependent receptor [Endomicrobiales bacterium]
MKKVCVAPIMLFVFSFLIGPDNAVCRETDELSAEALLFMEIPSVITASKKEETINKAPSVVYVVTAEEIKRSGARTLGDVLKRLPGFRLGFRETTIIGSRGFTSDQIDKFVWLIDGAPITNILQDGPWGLLDIPNMDMVARIEIVKGPGSTLWGSNACLGIINVITKDGEKISGTQPSFSFSTRDEQTTGNILYGKKTDKMDYMFSFTFTQSKGFENTGAGYNKVYYWGGESQNTDYDNYKLSGQRGHNSPLIDLQPSWEFYGKVKADTLSVKTRASYTRQGYLWGSNLDADLQDVVFKHMYTEVEKEYELSMDTLLTNKINFHTLAYDRGILVSRIDPMATTDLETKTEMGLSIESIIKKEIADRHIILAGVKFASTEFGPSQRQQFMVGSGSTTLNGGYPNGYKYSYVTDVNREDTSGLYIEDTFNATDALTLVAGLSFEYSDFIEVGGKLMPRGAAIYQLSGRLSTKYCYNTGYERPPIDKKFHKMFGHVEKSEDIEEHDLQLSYNANNTRASVTGFYYKISNYFTWITIVDSLGNTLEQGHGNSGEGTSDGFEFDIRHKISNKIAVFGNWTYANTKINKASPNGDPRQIYNIGTDYYLNNNLSVNLNINGFIDMPNGYPNGGVWRGDGEELVDLAIVADNVYGRPLTITLFAKNLLDVKSHVTMTGWPGYTYAEAASYGTKLAYKF